MDNNLSRTKKFDEVFNALNTAERKVKVLQKMLEVDYDSFLSSLEKQKSELMRDKLIQEYEEKLNTVTELSNFQETKIKTLEDKIALLEEQNKKLFDEKANAIYEVEVWRDIVEKASSKISSRVKDETQIRFEVIKWHSEGCLKQKLDEYYQMSRNPIEDIATNAVKHILAIWWVGGAVGIAAARNLKTLISENSLSFDNLVVIKDFLISKYEPGLEIEGLGNFCAPDKVYYMINSLLDSRNLNNEFRAQLVQHFFLGMAPECKSKEKGIYWWSYERYKNVCMSALTTNVVTVYRENIGNEECFGILYNKEEFDKTSGYIKI